MTKKVLIIGFGSIGKRHYRIVSEHSIIDHDIRILSGSQSDNNLRQLYLADLADAIKFKPDIVIISNPAPYHLTYAMHFARLGCNLLIEKPISNSLDDIAKLKVATNAYGGYVQIGYNLKFHPLFQHFKDEIEKANLGKILFVDTHVGQDLRTWRPGTDYRASVTAKSNLGGGALLELSHEIDYLVDIFGCITSVRASISKLSSLEIDVEDYANLICHHQTSKFSSVLSRIQFDLFRPTPSRKCTVFFEDGFIEIDWIHNSINVFSNGILIKPYSLTNYDRDLSYIRQWNAFLRNIQSTKAIANIESASHILKVVLSARTSNDLKGAETNVI